MNKTIKVNIKDWEKVTPQYGGIQYPERDDTPINQNSRSNQEE